MKERPILFSGPMVRAILDGRKTQTRRVMKWPRHLAVDEQTIEASERMNCPYGRPGDRLWVKEKWCTYPWNDHLKPSEIPHSEDLFIMHDENDINYLATPIENYNAGKTRPSIFMPRWASRRDLEVTGVRAERVQDISGNDAIAEGIEYTKFDWMNPIRAFSALWDSINAKLGYGWDTNPWVWVVDFENA